MKPELRSLQSELIQTLRQLPHYESFEETQQRIVNETNEAFGNFRSYDSLESMGNLCPLDSMFHFAQVISGKHNNIKTPVILVKTSQVGKDMFELTKAFKAFRLTFAVEPILDISYPLFREVLAIEDRAGDPLMLEGVGDIANKDIQNYVLSLAQAHTQIMVLYRLDNSLAAMIDVALDDDFRQQFWQAFLSIAQIYGTQLRPKGAWKVAASQFQQNNLMYMPAPTLTLREAKEVAISELIEELVKIGSNIRNPSPSSDGFIYRDENGRYIKDPRTIQIGELLNSIGGMSLMQAVHQQVRSQVPYAARSLEILWHGIGRWMM